MTSFLGGPLSFVVWRYTWLEHFQKNLPFSMVEFQNDAPLKILIEDVRHFEKFQDGWVFKSTEGNLSLNRVIIQGEIIRTAGFSDEILIIDDGTGKAKVTRGAQVPGNLSWINTGLHCSVIGTLLENGKLPLIHAEKIARISNQVLLEMWPWEVKELKDVLANKSFPTLLEENGYNSDDHF